MKDSGLKMNYRARRHFINKINNLDKSNMLENFTKDYRRGKVSYSLAILTNILESLGKENFMDKVVILQITLRLSKDSFITMLLTVIFWLYFQIINK